MLIVIFFNALIGIVLGFFLSILTTIVLYDFFNFVNQSRECSGKLKSLYIALIKLLRSTKDIICLKTEGYKVSKEIRTSMNKLFSNIFSSLKPVVGLSSIAFLMGAFYISCFTKYYGINNYINISFIDYILYFFQLLMYTSSKEFFTWPVVILFSYFFIVTYFFSGIDMSNKNIKKDALKMSATSKKQNSKTTLILLFSFLIPFTTLLIFTYIDNQIKTSIKNSVISNIQKNNKISFLLKDNDYMYFIFLDKAKIALLPLNPAKTIKTNDGIIEQASYIVPISSNLKTSICKFLTTELKTTKLSNKTRASYSSIIKNYYATNNECISNNHD
ncbi:MULTISPECIES: hypothetical protein [unclassified Francisella]|uniref:hypothetical protein n=1 Tax=unclassified Francisella TaxID=2610885 RepID=UPI002E2F0705|nr:MULTISPECIES: hypothetical protein [unclassified Francisella]MED7818316.1 hypothetical protein [Francisella sp. 19S2-4]MED7829152.1 hypothetical protein [Francisella sp. 19S2-10]